VNTLYNTIYNFAFIKTHDIDTVKVNIVLINRSRHHSVGYERIILTEAHHEWCALIIDSNEPDHYLIRNLSGRLNATGFEFGINGIRLFYRLHEDGRTVSAYESHLALWVTQQLRNLVNTADVMGLDLAEPAGRLVLRRYHEHQRSRAWTQPSANEKVPITVETYYQGNAADLSKLFVQGTTTSYIQEILSPGFSPETALERLVEVLNLPYLTETQPELTKSSEDSAPGERIVKGYDILKPATWTESATLPTGWHIISSESWQNK
jgi:hypothetical protein